MGFYQVWSPRAPAPWREARKAWACECREILATNRRALDSEDQLCRYLDANPWEYPPAQIALTRWREVRPTFVPNSVPVWISDVVLDWIAARDLRGTLIWTERPAVGERLAAKLGARYYGEGGICTATGAPVESHDPARHGPAVLAMEPNSRGRNLQAWSRNLILDVTKSARRLEQLLGRTHRPGQVADKVSITFLIGVREDVEAMDKVRDRAESAAILTGQPQKILHALPSRDAPISGLPSLPLPGPRWAKSRPPAGRAVSNFLDRNPAVV